MKKCRVLLLIGSRSDEGLSAPVLNRLENDDFFRSYVQTLYGGSFPLSFNLANKIMKDLDLVICTGDRREMFAGAIPAFLNNIPIAHIYAGNIVEGHPTKDEIFRHSISLMSDIQFVESKKSMMNLEMLFIDVKKKSNCHLVGTTHLDDLEIDESLVPGGWYNLILYNPITNKEKVSEMGGEIERIKMIANFKINTNIIIGANPDPWYYYNPITMENPAKRIIFYKNLPRSKFLGLLKNCQKFITNSSTALYEAPYFLEDNQIINIGIRNNKRTPVDITMTGASDKIIKIIKEWWLEKNG